MLDLGVTAEQIGYFGTTASIAALLSYILYPRLPKPRGEHHFLCICALIITLSPLLFAFAGLSRSIGLVIVLMMFGIVLKNVAGGLQSTSEFALSPALFPRTYYAKAIGLGGMIGSGIACLISVIGTVITKDQSTYRVFFLTATATLLLRAFIIPCYRILPEQTAKKAALSVREILGALCQTKWKRILLPHLIRGVTMGGMFYTAVVTLPNVSVNSGLLIAVIMLGNMLGNFIFFKQSARVSSRKMILFANCACAALLLVIPFVRIGWLYLAVYMLYNLTNTLSQNCIPTGVLRSTSSENMPFMSAMRMFYTSAAKTIVVLCLAPFAGGNLSYLILVGTAVIMIAVAVLYANQFTDCYS